jgi:glucose-6-phosphate-specific signal transduction histidine kinase
VVGVGGRLNRVAEIAMNYVSYYCALDRERVEVLIVDQGLARPIHNPKSHFGLTSVKENTSMIGNNLPSLMTLN